MPKHRASKRNSGDDQAAAPAVAGAPGAIEATNTAAWNAGDPDAETAKLAYSYWEARGRTGGSASEDWFRAKQELNARQRL